MSNLAFHPTAHAIANYLRSYELKPEGKYTDIRGFLELVRPQIHLNLALKVKLIKSKVRSIQTLFFAISRRLCSTTVNLKAY